MKKILAYLLSLSVLFSAGGCKKKINKDVKNDDGRDQLLNKIIYEEETFNSELSKEEEKDNKVEVVISAVGDCTLGRDDRGSYAYSLPYYLETNNYDYSYFFKGVYDILSNDDLTIANLEGTLTDSTDRAEKQFTFKGDSSYTNILSLGSVEVVNLANNHTMDFGKEGYEDTKVALDEADIGYFGNGIFEIAEIKGIKVGLAGIKGFSLDSAKAEIDKAKSYFDLNDVQLIIYNFHWGVEREYKQNSTQEEIARYAVDKGGANLVIGHHPHVLQGIEKYNGVYIVYSLGNFVFGGNKNPSDKDTMIIQMSFTFNNLVLEETKLNIIPATLSSSTSRNDYQPTIPDEEKQAKILKRVLDNSTNFRQD